MRFAEYLPEIGTTSFDVSLDLLCDRKENYKCLHHTKQRSKTAHKHDAVIDNDKHKCFGLVDLTGVGRPQRGGPLSDLDGHLNCGCSVKDAVLEIYLFKTMFGFSTNPAFSHLKFLWEPDTIIPTYVRAFLVALFRKSTGLDGNSPELFTGVEGWGPAPREWASKTQLQTIKMQTLRHALTECFKVDDVPEEDRHHIDTDVVKVLREFEGLHEHLVATKK